MPTRRCKIGAGYFITFGIYGSHLHGDARGSWRRGQGAIAADQELHERMESRVDGGVLRLSLSERAHFFDEIVSYGYDSRVIVDAVNVRTTHVHMLVFPLEETPAYAIVRAVKIRLTEKAQRLFRLQTVDRLWERGYGCGLVRSWGAWYGMLQYTLFRQGSNAYMTSTNFARRNCIPTYLNEETDTVEPASGALRDAFCSNRVICLRKKALGGTQTEEEVEADYFDDGM